MTNPISVKRFNFTKNKFECEIGILEMKKYSIVDVPMPLIVVFPSKVKK